MAPTKSTTLRPQVRIRAALLHWFSKKENHAKSNRYAAKVLKIDEGTVRKFRHENGIPSLLPGSGRSSLDPQTPRRKKV